MTLFEAAEAPEPSDESSAVQRVRMTVVYDGTEFHGFAVQERQRTVGGVLIEALQTALRREVELTCAGRTDRGVHAWGQVVSFDAPHDVDLCRLRRSVNSMLGPEVVVRDAAIAASDFSARFDAADSHVPVHDRQSRRARPVPCPLRLVDRRAARPACTAHRQRRLHR